MAVFETIFGLRMETARGCVARRHFVARCNCFITHTIASGVGDSRALDRYMTENEDNTFLKNT